MGGFDPYEDSELSNLPPEAWGNIFDVDSLFDPANSWLKTAEKHEQLTAMREWFAARYCDPAHETPYNGREGGYLFLEGGPYNPSDELGERFSGIVDDEVIDELAEQLVHEVGDQWAPIRRLPPDDYDERFDLELVGSEEPLQRLQTRIGELKTTLSLQSDTQAKLLVSRLVFGALIGVLESFLWETAQHWIESREDVLRRCIEKLPVFREQTMKLSDVFEQHAKVKETVKGYLQNLVWHRWDQVGALYRDGLGIRLPSVKALEKPLQTRHNIVHRSGTDMEGQLIAISEAEIEELANVVAAFAEETTTACLAKFEHEF